MKWPPLACMISLLLTACVAAKTDGPPPTITLPGAPNSVAIEADGAILITDDSSNSVLRSTGFSEFPIFAQFPTDGTARNALSQIATGSTHDVFVERFGFGTDGAIFHIDASGHVTVASSAHPERRRLGLFLLSKTQLLSSWVVKTGDNPAQGGVSVVTLDPATGHATERDLVAGLAKPVGIEVVGDTLYVSDQGANRIVATSLQAALSAASPVQATRVLAQVQAPDLLAASADGALYTKCGNHAVCRISATGQVSMLADGFDEPRGVAIDQTHKRLLAIDRGRSGRPSHLRIVPLE